MKDTLKLQIDVEIDVEIVDVPQQAIGEPVVFTIEVGEPKVKNIKEIK